MMEVFFGLGNGVCHSDFLLIGSLETRLGMLLDPLDDTEVVAVEGELLSLAGVLIAQPPALYLSERGLIGVSPQLRCWRSVSLSSAALNRVSLIEFVPLASFMAGLPLD